MKSCRKAQRAIRLRLDQSLALERELELDAHLEECENCSSFANRAARLEEALVGLAEPPVARLDVERAVRVVRERIDGSESTRDKTGSREQPRGKALAIAAGLLLLLGAAVAIALWRGRVEPTRPGDRLAGNEEVDRETAPERALDSPVEEAPLDRELLAQKRDEVRQQLVQCAQGLSGDASREEALAFAQLFDVDTIHLRRDEWPVRRIVEGLLDGEELDAARAAARYLGVRGDSLAAWRLKGALERKELAEAATRALGDLGADGKDGLVIALGRPGLRAVALDGVASLKSDQAADILSRALIGQQATRTVEPAPDEDLLTALCDLGHDAIRPLLELGERGVLKREQLLAALDDTPGAPEFFAGFLQSAQGRQPSDVAIVATARFAPDRALAWLEDRLHDRRRRDFARRELPRVGGERTVAALVRLQADSRLGAEVHQEMTSAALASDAERFVRYGQAAIAAELEGELISLAELLLASDSSLAIGAVSLLSRQPELESSLRQALVLAIGDHGGGNEVTTLQEIFATLGTGDRHLAAACVLSLSKLGSDEACAVALEGADRRSVQNILSLLNRRKAGGRTYPSIYRLARELKHILEDRDRENWRTSS